MTSNIVKKTKTLIGTVLTTFLLFASATGIEGSHHKNSISHYVSKCPWIGLITNEITYGAIKISHLNLNDDGKLTIVNPGEKIKGNLRYKIDVDHMKSFHLYHLIIGLKGEGPQDCVSHSFGLWDSKGTGTFELEAPKKSGIYEVRISYSEGLTCSAARDTWGEEGEPSSDATIGILIVE